MVEEHYQRLGHASEGSIHVWRRAPFPEGTTDAQIYGAVAGYERTTGVTTWIDHPLPRGFVSGCDVRRQRQWSRYCDTWD